MHVSRAATSLHLMCPLHGCTGIQTPCSAEQEAMGRYPQPEAVRRQPHAVKAGPGPCAVRSGAPPGSPRRARQTPTRGGSSHRRPERAGQHGLGHGVEPAEPAAPAEWWEPLALALVLSPMLLLVRWPRLSLGEDHLVVRNVRTRDIPLGDITAAEAGRSGIVRSNRARGSPRQRSRSRTLPSCGLGRHVPTSSTTPSTAD